MLKEYKNVHGNVDVPRKYTENLQLGKWTYQQCTKCKDKEGMALLSILGFNWETQLGATWLYSGEEEDNDNK